jgi:hypothetical protein
MEFKKYEWCPFSNDRPFVPNFMIFCQFYQTLLQAAYKHTERKSQDATIRWNCFTCELMKRGYKMGTIAGESLKLMHCRSSP